MSVINPTISMGENMDKNKMESLTALATKMVSGYVIPGTKGDDKAVPPVKATNTKIYAEITGLVTEEVKDGKKILVPQTINPKTVFDLGEAFYTEVSEDPSTNPSAEDILSAVAEYRGSKFLAVINRKIEGFTSCLNSRPGVTEVEEIHFLAKSTFAAMFSFFKENTQEKTADPFLSVKRIYAGSYTNTEILAHKAGEIVAKTISALQTEIDRLETLKIRASEVSPEDYIAFCDSKRKENGVDDDSGRIRLKAKKAPKADDKKEDEIENLDPASELPTEA